MEPIIVVHGGAGSWIIKEEYLELAIEHCRNAAGVGQELLLSGATAVEAVEAAVRVLEDSPILDAGRGSYFNRSGQIEMDALIMDGASLEMGAIASVQRILHPITLARRLMSEGKHNMLVGAGAEQFADSIGFPRCQFEDLLAPDPEMQSVQSSATEDSFRAGDTVGAVALDGEGNVASATSTGGTRDKHPGRVGDSPLVGCGSYADNWSAAVSATGEGEALMRVVISKRVCDFVANGLSAQRACEAAIQLLAERTEGHGGLIAVDVRGRVGIAFNTQGMPHAYAVGQESIITGH
jgi:beta-aspartyl-peptidase (threonine type)